MNTRHIFIPIIGLALFACSSGHEWKNIYTISKPEEEAGDIYIKPETIMIDGSTRRVWTKWI